MFTEGFLIITEQILVARSPDRLNFVRWPPNLVLSMELASCHPSGAQYFVVGRRFLWKLSVHCSWLVLRSMRGRTGEHTDSCNATWM